MKHTWILAAVMLGVTGCGWNTAGGGAAARDGAAEGTKYCYKYVPTGSRIPRKRCVTDRRKDQLQRRSGARAIEKIQHTSSLPISD